MPIYFNGQYIVQPQSIVTVDDSAMIAPNATQSDVLVLIGSSVSGPPKTAIPLTSYSDAQAKLRGGSLLQACQRAYAPYGANGNATPQIIAIRVDPATQATLNLTDGTTNTLVTLTSVDYGAWTNQTKVMVTAGSTSGYKASVGNDYDNKPVVTQDNIGYNILSIYYTGTKTNPTLTISGTQLTIQSGTTPTVEVTVTFTSTMTAQQLVNQINAANVGYVATLTAQNPNFLVVNALDYAANVAIGNSSSPTSVTANLQALVDWFNSGAQPYVTATRNTSATTTTLATMSTYRYLTGGSDGTPTTSDWQAVYSYLQTLNVSVVVPLTSQQTIWAMNDSHCQYMASQGLPRTGIVGDAAGKTLAAQIANVQTLNSDRTMLVWPGIKDRDMNGNITILDPFYVAAQIGGALVSSPAQNALTGRLLAGLDLEYNPTPNDITTGLLGGICLLTKTFQGQIEIARSQTTWLQTTSYVRREISTRRVTDAFVMDLQKALNAQIRGQAGSPASLALAVSICNSLGKQYQDKGYIVGDDQHPAYKGFTATLEGDVMKITGQISPAVPVNYIPVTLYAVPYSGVAA